MDTQELLMTALRASVIYLFLLVVIRILGKREVGNATAFDFLVALMLGEVVDEPVFGDVPMIQGLLAITIIGAWHYANSLLTYNSQFMDKLLGGKPTELVKNGEMDRRAMAKERVNEEELWSLLRMQQIEELRDVKRATLETSGQLSVIKNDSAQTLEKRDLEQAREGV